MVTKACDVPNKGTLIANLEALVRLIRSKKYTNEEREIALEAHAKIIQNMIDAYYANLALPE